MISIVWLLDMIISQDGLRTDNFYFPVWANFDLFKVFRKNLNEPKIRQKIIKITQKFSKSFSQLFTNINKFTLHFWILFFPIVYGYI